MAKNSDEIVEQFAEEKQQVAEKGLPIYRHAKVAAAAEVPASAAEVPKTVQFAIE